MGWSSDIHPRDKKDVVAELTSKALKVRVVGNHVWALYQYTRNEKPYKLIVLCLLEKHDGCWSWKEMDESWGPHYYDCPLALLKESDLSTDHAQKWAADVRTWHAAQAVKRKATVEIGKTYTTHSGLEIEIRNSYRRGWVAIYPCGGTFKVTKGHINWAVPAQ